MGVGGGARVESSATYLPATVAGSFWQTTFRGLNDDGAMSMMAGAAEPRAMKWQRVITTARLEASMLTQWSAARVYNS